MMQLSSEIMVEVMLEVDSAQIYQLALVSKCMTDILSDSYFWKRRYEKEGLYPEEAGSGVVARLHSYALACKIKKRLSVLDREQSFPQMFVCGRKCTLEELQFIFFFRPNFYDKGVYRLTLGVNKNKEFYFVVETHKEIVGNGFLLRHNLASLVLRDVCSLTEMRKLLYRCYSLSIAD